VAEVLAVAQSPYLEGQDGVEQAVNSPSVQKNVYVSSR
jgi:hypothetical protein